MASDKPQISDEVIHECLVRGVASVFQVMLRMEITFAEKSTVYTPPPPSGKTQLIGNVGFGGKINGLVYMAMTEDFAKTLAARMLGLQPLELAEHGPEAVTDALGEITNMTVGAFKNTLSDQGFPCKLTVPTIVRGRNLSVSAMRGTTRQLFHFDCVGERITVDLHMQVE